jgi:hypothetical protein
MWTNRSHLRTRPRYLWDGSMHKISSQSDKPLTSYRINGRTYWQILECTLFLSTQKQIASSVQVNQHSYPYFHRNFAAYGPKQLVKEPNLLLILDTVIRHRIQGRIFTVYVRIHAVTSLSFSPIPALLRSNTVRFSLSRSLSKTVL